MSNRQQFLLPNVTPGTRVRFDTASGSYSAADVVDNLNQAISGSILTGDKTGRLASGDLYGPVGVTTLYMKTLDGSGNVTGSPTTLASAHPASASSDPSKAFELVPLTGFGHSFVAGQNVDAGTSFLDRVSKRLLSRSFTNRGVGGTRLDQILTAVQTNWTVGTRGAVGLMVTLNDLGYADVAGATTSKECFRALLAHLTAGWSLTATSNAFTYDVNWSGTTTSTNGALLSVAFNGDTAHVRVNCVTGAGGTLTATGGASLATGGYKNAFTGVLTLSGYGPGDHTVTLTASGGAVTIAGLYVANGYPPAIVWVKEAVPVGTVASDFLLLRDTYLPALSAVAATFPVTVVDLSADGWDFTSYIGPDNVHPNDLGHAVIADRIVAAVKSKAFRQGLNVISALTVPTYSAPTASYPGPPTAPGQVTSVSAVPSGPGQVLLSWTAPSSGGSALTDYVIRYRTPNGSGGYTTFSHSASTATSATVTGLTNGSAYGFTVAAVNAIGTGTASAEVVATPLNITVYASDDFTRADGSPGSTPVGSLAWTTASGTWAVSSNSLTLSAGTSQSELYITDANVNGAMQAKLQHASNLNVGLLFRASSAADGYIFYADSATTFALKKITAGPTYTTLVSFTRSYVQGDVLRVELSGTSIICKVNGTTIISTTDATYGAGTRKGFWAFNSVGSLYDDFLWASA